MKTLSELLDVLSGRMSNWYSVIFASADGAELSFSDYDGLEMVYIRGKNIPGIGDFGGYYSFYVIDDLKDYFRKEFGIRMDEPKWYVHPATFDSLECAMNDIRHEKSIWEQYKKESQNEDTGRGA